MTIKQDRWGFIQTWGKKKTSISSKLQITESEKFLGCVFFPGDCHSYKPKLKPGRFSVSEQRDQRRTCSKFTKVYALRGQQNCFWTTSIIL